MARPLGINTITHTCHKTKGRADKESGREVGRLSDIEIILALRARNSVAIKMERVKLLDRGDR